MDAFFRCFNAEFDMMNANRKRLARSIVGFPRNFREALFQRIEKDLRIGRMGCLVVSLIPLAIAIPFLIVSLVSKDLSQIGAAAVVVLIAAGFFLLAELFIRWKVSYFFTLKKSLTDIAH